MDFPGTEASVAEQARMVERIAGEHGGTHFAWATDPEERRKLWQARYDAYYALKATRPGGEAWVTDVCVPISRLAECITETQNDIAASLSASILGHAGEGNFHVGFNLLPNDPREMAEAKRLNERSIHRALALDGTCTGEHGIGCGKIEFLLAEHGQAVQRHARDKKSGRSRQYHEPGQDSRSLETSNSLGILIGGEKNAERFIAEHSRIQSPGRPSADRIAC